MISFSDLADKHAIEQIYIRYCELIDAKDFDRLSDVFTEDTYGHYSFADGSTTESHSRAALIASMHANLGKTSLCGATHHNVGNFRVRIEGNRAFAKVNYFAVHRGTGRLEGALYSMWGLYDDELVRTDAGWRVHKRSYSNAVSEGPVVTLPQGS